MNAASLHLLTGLGIALISIGCLLAAAAILLILRNSPKQLRAILNKAEKSGKSIARSTSPEESETPQRNLIATPVDPPALKAEITALLHPYENAPGWTEYTAYEYTL